MKPIFQYARIISEDELDKMNEAVLAILENPGMRFENERLLKDKLSKEEFRNRLTKRGNSASQIMHAIADGISLETIGENLIWPLNAEETKELLLSLNLIKLEEDY